MSEQRADRPWEATENDASGKPPDSKKGFPIGRLAWIVVPVLLIGYCSIAGSRSSDTSGTPSTEKYTQTWSKSYADTTCSDWLGNMTKAQEFAAAADMLAGARNKGDGGTGLPSDALINEFSGGITTACVVPTATLTDIAVALYLTERERFKP